MPHVGGGAHHAQGTRAFLTDWLDIFIRSEGGSHRLATQDKTPKVLHKCHLGQTWWSKDGTRVISVGGPGLRRQQNGR